jgi:hypothetical protein
MEWETKVKKKLKANLIEYSTFNKYIIMDHAEYLLHIVNVHSAT